MPLRTTVIYPYRAEGRTWALIVEEDNLLKAVRLWKLAGAPDPPRRTKLNSYEFDIVWFQRSFGEGLVLGLCAQSSEQSLEIQPVPGKPPASEQRFGTPAYVNGPVLIPDVGRWACSHLSFSIWLTTPPERDALTIISDLPSPAFTFDSHGPQLTVDGTPREIQLISWPPNEIEILKRIGDYPMVRRQRGHILIEEMRLAFQEIPPTTRPQRETTVPVPRAPREAPAPQRCWDPTTGEELDCKTGRPIEKDPCTEDFVRLPNLDDIVHFKPRPELPWVEKVDPLTGKPRWGFDRQLTIEEAEELIRRREIRQKIESTPVPEIIQQVAEIMQWIDNIQDALLTAIVFLRLFFPLMSPFLRNLMIGALGISDALQFLATFGFGQVPGGAVDTRRNLKFILDPRYASEAVRKVKRAIIVNGSIHADGKTWNTEALRRLNRIVPTIGELFQVLQTTDWLFGVGISLGPIYGTILDHLFQLLQEGKIDYKTECLDSIRARTIKQLEGMGLIPLGELGSKPWEVQSERAAQEAADIARRLGIDREFGFGPLTTGSGRVPAAPFTQSEYLQVLAGYDVFLDMTLATTRGQDIDALLVRFADTPAPTPQNPGRTDDVLRSIRALQEKPPQMPQEPRSRPTPVPITPLKVRAASHARALQNHLALNPTSNQAFYIRTLADDIARKNLMILDPLQREPRWTPTGNLRVLHVLLDRGFIPPVGSTSAEIFSAVDALKNIAVTHGQNLPNYDTSETLLRSRGWRAP